jgi:hypothetical protein
LAARLCENILEKLLGRIIDAMVRLGLRSSRANQSLRHAGRTIGTRIAFHYKGCKSCAVNCEGCDTPTGTAADNQHGYREFEIRHRG